MLFGKVPVLEIDGKQFAESLAIARYFGRKFGLVGDTLEDALEIDQTVDLINDLRASKFYLLSTQIKNKLQRNCRIEIIHNINNCRHSDRGWHMITRKCLL